MDDQGEKIVYLVRTMLRDGFALGNVAEHPLESKPISLKTLYLAAVLAALGGGGLTHWVHEERRAINFYEETELEALVFYASKVGARDAAVLRQEILDRLGAQSLRDMSVQDYRDTKNYLQKNIRWVSQ